MSAVLVGRFDHDSAEWHAARADGIGGSEIASILGLSPWVSARALWHLKRQEWAGEPDSARFRAGHYCEPSITAYLRDQFPDLTIRTERGTYHHPDRPWQRVNVDGLGYATPRSRTPVAVIEDKTENDPWKWGTPGTAEVPVFYKCQGLWGCDVMGADRVIFGVQFGNFRFAHYVVEYDADECAYMRDRAVAFLASLDGAAPPVDASDSTYEVLREIHPGQPEGDHDVGTVLAGEFVSAVRGLRAAESRADFARNLLMEAMGDARRAMWAGRSIATRQRKGEGKPYLKASANLPDLAPIPDDPTDVAADLLERFRAMPAIPTEEVA